MLSFLLGSFALLLVLGTLKAPNVGEVLLLKYMLNDTSEVRADVELRLYTNDQTPAEEDTLALNYTEATAAGYTGVSLNGTEWTVGTATNITTAEFAEQTFSFSTSETVYGYYVSSEDADEVLWSERFTGAPFSIPSGGGTIAITPKITLD